MKIHVEVLFTQDENACLRGVNEPVSDAKPAPRFFFGRTNEGSIRRFRYDLPENVVTQLEELAVAEPMFMGSRKFPRSLCQFEAILQSHAPIERVWIGPAYRFPERILAQTGGISRGDK